MTTMMIRWQWCSLADLSATEVFALYQLRQAVFIIEQQCIYPDIDGADLTASHLLGWVASEAGEGDQLAAYLRALPPDDNRAEPAIGRVIIAPDYRGQQLGGVLMREGIARTQAAYPDQSILISAQAHLQRFYGGLGFVVCSDIYDEDGIDHIDMRLPTVSESYG